MLDSDLLLFATVVNGIFASLIIGSYLLIFESFPDWCVTVKNILGVAGLITILHFGFWLIWIFPKADNIGAVLFFILLTMPFSYWFLHPKKNLAILKN